jgi:hypothetical protein
LDEREGAKSLTQLSLWGKMANLGHRTADCLLHTHIDTKRRGSNREEGLSTVVSALVWAAFYQPEGGEERGQEQALDGPVVGGHHGTHSLLGRGNCGRGCDGVLKGKWRWLARSTTLFIKKISRLEIDDDVEVGDLREWTSVGHRNIGIGDSHLEEHAVTTEKLQLLHGAWVYRDAIRRLLPLEDHHREIILPLLA